jgi:phospholipid-binding lipoprotein MlaA
MSLRGVSARAFGLGAMGSVIRLLAACAASVAMLGCASAPGAAGNPTVNDPWEPMNRSVFSFNMALDNAVIKPVATAYQAVLPKPVRTGVNNFFGNLKDVWSFANNVLQFKGEAAVESAMRVSVNTVLGLGGVLDVASDIGIERHTQTFGQTLGYWGMGPGPYLVLPLLGPSTLRDTAALPVDFRGDIVSRHENEGVRNSLKALEIVDLRASLLKASSVIDSASLDPYLFTRDAFLQRKRSAIYDGNPPDEDPPEKPAAKP